LSLQFSSAAIGEVVVKQLFALQQLWIHFYLIILFTEFLLVEITAQPISSQQL